MFKNSLVSSWLVENSAQLVNVTSVILSAVTVVFPVTKIIASKHSHRLDLIHSVSNLVELLCLKKSLIAVLDVESSAEFVNATSVILSAVTVISPVTKINVSK